MSAAVDDYRDYFVLDRVAATRRPHMLALSGRERLLVVAAVTFCARQLGTGADAKSLTAIAERLGYAGATSSGTAAPAPTAVMSETCLQHGASAAPPERAGPQGGPNSAREAWQ